jgi:hypothetical protein
MNRSLLMTEAIFLYPLLDFHYAGVRPFLAILIYGFGCFYSSSGILKRCRFSCRVC